LVSEKNILDVLSQIAAPDGTQSDAGQNIVQAGMVSGLQISPANDVLFMIEVDPKQGAVLEPLRQQAERLVQNIQGVNKVTAILTAEAPAESAQARPPQSAAHHHPDPHGMAKNPRLSLNAKKIIVVASGKGGVGKSTVSVNLAHALAQNGLSVGLLDADIYGPSIPKMLALEGQRPKTNKQNLLEPLKAHGMQVMSIGFLLENQDALIWRGPMAQSAVYQMLRDVAWGKKKKPLDVLVIDMPPGTGDIQLTLAQKVDVDGAVIVSTPQDIALIDARKAVEMFRKVEVPVLGVIENMSTHVCSNCGHEEHIFGHGGAQQEAQKQGVPFLGDVPLSASIRAQSDAGKPGVEALKEIAGRVKDAIS